MIYLIFLLVSFQNVLHAEQFRAVLEPHRQTNLASEVETTVSKIEKRMGESFDKGEILLTLDDTVFSANFDKAKALFKKAEADFEAKRRLFQDKVASRSEFREAEANLSVAQANLVFAKKSYDACFIDGPYSGKVVHVYIKEFERVQPGQNLIEILDDSILIAKLLLPEKYLFTTNVGDELKLTIQETGTQHNATIVRVGAIIDPVSSLFRVDAEIDNFDGQLRAGMEGMSEVKR